MRQWAIHSSSRCSPNLVLVLLMFMTSNMIYPPWQNYAGAGLRVVRLSITATSIAEEGEGRKGPCQVK
jgi:hypothetical protein